jgi:hypothetical protein
MLQVPPASLQLVRDFSEQTMLLNLDQWPSLVTTSHAVNVIFGSNHKLKSQYYSYQLL